MMSDFSFPSVFPIHLENFPPFSSNLKLSSAKSFTLEESKICCLVKGYKLIFVKEGITRPALHHFFTMFSGKKGNCFVQIKPGTFI